jgi:nucleoside-diphosphate-sugar epimerase
MMTSVAITGASGRVGQALAKELPATLSVIAIDRKCGVDLANVSGLEGALAGADAIVHLAADPRVDADWQSVLRDNIIATHNLYEAARRLGIRRVVFASSNHVVGEFEKEAPYAPVIAGVTLPEAEFPYLDHRVPIRPDSHYGVSKAAGEAIAAHYFERHGVESVCLRIGSVTATGLPENQRHLATWLSNRDLSGLVMSALTARDVGCAIVYGVSRNRRRIWDIAHARDVLGFQPADDAETVVSTARAGAPSAPMSFSGKQIK